MARLRGDTEHAIAYGEEARRLLTRQGDAFFMGHLLSTLGLLYLHQGESERAKLLFEEALAAREELGDRTGILGSLRDLGQLALASGDLSVAAERFEQSLTIARDLGDRSGTADALLALGRMARAKGTYLLARERLEASLRIRRELGQAMAFPEAFDELAHVLAASGQVERAVRLSGAARGLREKMGAPAVAEPASLKICRRTLSVVEYQSALQAGQALSLEQAIDCALSAGTAHAITPEQRVRRRAGPEQLTRREYEVAALLAAGLSNRAIGARLVITEGTAEVHVRNILSKLGFTSRSQAAVWAAQQDPAAAATIKSR